MEWSEALLDSVLDISPDEMVVWDPDQDESVTGSPPARGDDGGPIRKWAFRVVPSDQIVLPQTRILRFSASHTASGCRRVGWAACRGNSDERSLPNRHWMMQVPEILT